MLAFMIFAFLLFFIELFFKSSFLVITYCLALSYLIFLPFQSPLQFRVGEIVNHDLISPYSFEMTDEVTTEDKRIKAENSVLTVYDYDPQIFQNTVLNIYKSFKNMRQILRESKKANNSALKIQFEKEINFSVSELTFEWLSDHKFHPKLEAALIRILERWYDQKIAESPDRVIPSG